MPLQIAVNNSLRFRRSIKGLTIAFLLSVNKKKISLRTVGAALVLQVVIGGIM
ncbi:MAG: Na+ dependent nucleoside transporter N-terminal domain-containing protein, partial [Escherichia coli]|nr:Na+ dependent nucleoside transporter N-terminal domain-containing protein [Escherichia coli]